MELVYVFNAYEGIPNLRRMPLIIAKALARVFGFEYACTLCDIRGWHSLDEICMADECEFGCKVYRCTRCNFEGVVHMASYGCRG